MYFRSIYEKRYMVLSENYAGLKMPDGFVVAMAYVPWQEFESMYPPETALKQGTLFPELDKPFEGMTVNGGKNG